MIVGFTTTYAISAHHINMETLIASFLNWKNVKRRFTVTMLEIKFWEYLLI
jgi:hypothetical protein